MYMQSDNSRHCRVGRFLGVLTGLFMAISGLNAQQNPGGRIFYAHGSEFALIFRGEEGSYEPAVLIDSNLVLENGDMVRTGPGSFLEFQVIPDGTAIKIAENSFVQYGFDQNRKPIITLHYGRVRIITGYQAGKPALAVRAGNGSMDVWDGDYCFDYAVSPLGMRTESDEVIRPMLQIFAFRGLTEITLSSGKVNGAAFSNNWPLIPVNELEWVSVEANSSLALIERRSMDAEMLWYWTENNFRGTTFLPIPDTALPSLDSAPVVTAASLPRDTQGRQPAVGRQPVAAVKPPPRSFLPGWQLKLKNGLLIGGISLTTVGLLAQTFGYFVLNPDDPAVPRVQVGLGYIPIGIGISSLLVSLFVNPTVP
jgi:hypothetical protein